MLQERVNEKNLDFRGSFDACHRPSGVFDKHTGSACSGCFTDRIDYQPADRIGPCDREYRNIRRARNKRSGRHNRDIHS